MSVRHATNGYLSGLPFQRGFHDITPFNLTPSTKSALAPFETARNTEMRPYQGVPRTQDTFAFSHQNEIATIVDLTFDSIETTDGWEAVYAPFTATSTLHQQILIVTADDFMLERTAENTAPRHLDLREEQYSISMEHWQLGFGMNREQLISDKGLKELTIKTRSFISAVIRTLKIAVKGAAITALNYWGQQYQSQQRFNSVGDADAQNIAMFGALTRNHKALSMIYAMVRGMFRNGPRRPNINMAVVGYGVAIQALWRNGGPTEAHRSGDAAAAQNLVAAPQDYLEGLLPGIKVYLDREYAPVNAHLDDDRYPIDAFRRRAHLGAYAVLEHCDPGPVDPSCGKPVPTIRAVTADANGWTEYSMRSCLLNCARFGDDGSITEFTQRLIDAEVEVKEEWHNAEYNRAEYDPWVYEPKLFPGQNVEKMRSRLRTCKHFGDQSPIHRPEEDDVTQGKKFKCTLGLTDEEDAQIRRLFEVAQFLYEVPEGSGLMAAKVSGLQGENNDPEWGAKFFRPHDNDAEGKNDLDNVIPWGCGDIWAVLAMLKNATGDQRKILNASVPLLASIEYPKVRSILYKIWDHVNDVYPHLAAKNASSVTGFRKTGNKRQDEMISVFRGLFERVKHPLWVSDSTAAAGTVVFDYAAYGISEIDDEDVHRKALANWKGEGDMNAALNMAQPDDDKQDENVLTISRRIYRNEALRMIASGQKVDGKVLEQLATVSVKFAESRITAGRVASTDVLNVALTSLTVDRSAFRPDGTIVIDGNRAFHATNAAVGMLPVIGREADDNWVGDKTLAQGHYGTAQDREKREEQRRRDQGFGPFDRKDLEIAQFATDPKQFIDARRANEIGGLFIEFDMVNMDGSEHPWLVESPNMSRRCAYVGKHLKNDPIARLGAFCFLASKVTRDSCLALLDHGMLVPMNFILAWPFIQVDTLAIMFAEGGIQTARCNYMLTDVTNPEDGIHKMLDWNLTMWLGAANTNPCNQVIVPDVACAGYVSGLSSKFIHPFVDGEGGNFKLSSSNFDGCIVMDVPVTFDRKSALLERHNPLPLCGKHDPAVYSGIYSRHQEIFNPNMPHFASWPAYNAWYGFTNINKGETHDPSSYSTLRRSSYIPCTMYMRRTQTWAGDTYSLDRGCKGTGHLDHIDPDKENFRGFLDGTLEFTDKYSSYT